MSCLGLIPARGGSKGVPHKNTRSLAGKPIIHYAIEAGFACPHIDRVVVTTNCEEIAKVAREAGAEVPFLRPDEIATDTAKQEDAVNHAMDWFEARGEAFDLLCMLQPTEPLRRVESLNKGFEMLAARPEATGILSVALAQSSPVNCNTLRADGTLKDFIDPDFRFANRQEKPDFYELSGVVAITRWRAFRQLGSFCQDTALSLVVDPIEAVDIDEPVDFILAETLLRRGLTSRQALVRHVGRDD